MSKSSSATQKAAPVASRTTPWRKRSYFRSFSATRAQSVSYATFGSSSQTPTIIIRLTSLSMRSHAVSTRDMRSRAAACIVSSAGLRPVAKGVLKMLGNIGGVNRDFHPTTQRRPVMADLKAQFEQAVAESKSLPEKPDNMTLLKLYALYKQASSGDAEGKRPGFGDMVGRAKWDAWNGLQGKSGDEAMQEYIDLIESLK